MGRQARTASAFGVLALILLPACSALPNPIPTPSPTVSIPPVRVVTEDSPGAIAGVGLSLPLQRNARGCLSSGSDILILPTGSTVEGDELHVPGFRALRLGDTVEGGGVVGEMKRDQASADLIACARSGEDPIAYVRFFPGG